MGEDYHVEEAMKGIREKWNECKWIWGSYIRRWNEWRYNVVLSAMYISGWEIVGGIISGSSFSSVWGGAVKGLGEKWSEWEWGRVMAANGE